MHETIKMIFFILFVIGGVFFALRIAGWKMKKASDLIINELRGKKAFDPSSAVELPYAKSSLFKIGLKDYRPGALQHLINKDIVRVSEGGKYYLREGHKLS